MFRKPIQHVPLKTMKEVKANSIRIGSTSAKPRTGFISNFTNNFILYVDESGISYITPYRYDISEVLSNFIDSIEVPNFPQLELYSECTSSDQYKWLEKIADEENWAYTYEVAYQIAKEKGIKPIFIAESITLRQIISKPLENCFGSTLEICHPLVNQFLTSGTSQNIGTYIHLSSKSLLVCDEYGRTFYIAVNGVINDIENQLIDAGYTRTMHPEKYVKYSSCNEGSTNTAEDIPDCYPF